VWADPIACTDVLGFGPLGYDFAKLPPGIKHPKYVYSGVVAGIGAYGNNMGVPTVNGAIYFDESYVGNVVVYCGCVGILPKKAYVRNVKPGDIIVLAGGRTGRDGIHDVLRLPPAVDKDEALFDFLKGLRIVLNNASAYPKDHPYFAKSVDDFKQKLDSLLAKNDYLGADINALTIHLVSDGDDEGSKMLSGASAGLIKVLKKIGQKMN
jgi:hypothetical protein